jgi:hypothetical protein
VTDDIDTLATALYVRTDDLLKQYPDLAPWRSKTGLQPRPTDAELMTLAVMQTLLSYTSESRWGRYARTRPGDLSRYLPGQPGYNRRPCGRRQVGNVSSASPRADCGHWPDRSGQRYEGR